MKHKTTRPIFPSPADAITTSRLLLRPIQASDLPAIHVLRTRIEVMKWTSQGRNDVDEDATQVWMNRFLPPNDATTFNFAVEELSSPGKAIGVLGCHIPEPPEVGYMFVEEVWGRGYATEALQAWLQAYWHLPRNEVALEEDWPQAQEVDESLEVVRADTDADNIASGRILAKCGFIKVGETMIERSGATVKMITHVSSRFTYDLSH
ncbi:hypothetical protein PV11_00228 [Exophiala sideris]|uniref:N-acetyltransferase domain-containing protein n=1 Tax=Exophiala sideris TaxID=1016849 RepID=A0A0D1YNM8_9EURO|nr:hypothetical protein PV11_00228 [Exophiala sideris]